MRNLIQKTKSYFFLNRIPLLLCFYCSIIGSQVAICIGYVIASLGRVKQEYAVEIFYLRLADAWLLLCPLGILAGILSSIVMYKLSLVKKNKLKSITIFCILTIVLGIYFQVYITEKIVPPLLQAANSGNFNKIKALIQRGENVNTKDFVDQTALMISSKKSFLNITDYLIDSGAQLNSTDISNFTALMRAVKGENIIDYSDMRLHESEDNRVRLIEKLIQGGSNVNAQNIKGETSLMMAITNKNSKIIDIILASGVDVNLSNYQGSTALIMACSGTSIDIVKALLGHAPQVNYADKEGRTALMKAIERFNSSDKYKIISTLIQAGANVNAQDIYGLTGLMIASQLRDEVSVEYLVKSHANINVTDKNNLNALFYARRSGNKKILNILTNEKRNNL